MEAKKHFDLGGCQKAYMIGTTKFLPCDFILLQTSFWKQTPQYFPLQVGKFLR